MQTIYYLILFYIDIPSDLRIQLEIRLSIYRFPQPVAPADKEKLDDLQKMSLKRKAQLHEIEQSLPAKSGRYLQVTRGWGLRGLWDASNCI